MSIKILMIEDGGDERIPEGYSPEQEAAFVSHFNADIERGIPEEIALEKAEEAVKTPEDRAESIGELAVDDGQR